MPQPHSQAFFESLFTQSKDPWHFESRWYEARKRALTLACLPEARYASAYEPGCANGELSAALAERCDRLLISDGSPEAVSAARERTRHLPHVEVRQAWLPGHWPVERFDLIVISEWAYYLGVDDIDTLALKIEASMASGGTLLACHWRRPIAGCALDGGAVNRRLANQLGWRELLRLDDLDFRLDVWSSDSRSVAQREGFA